MRTLGCSEVSGTPEKGEMPGMRYHRKGKATVRNHCMALIQADKLPIGTVVRLDDGTEYERKPRISFELEVLAEMPEQEEPPDGVIFFKCMSAQQWVAVWGHSHFVECAKDHLHFSKRAHRRLADFIDEEDDDDAEWTFG